MDLNNYLITATHDFEAAYYILMDLNLFRQEYDDLNKGENLLQINKLKQEFDDFENRRRIDKSESRNSNNQKLLNETSINLKQPTTKLDLNSRSDLNNSNNTKMEDKNKILIDSKINNTIGSPNLVSQQLNIFMMSRDHYYTNNRAKNKDIHFFGEPLLSNEEAREFSKFFSNVEQNQRTHEQTNLRQSTIAIKEEDGDLNMSEIESVASSCLSGSSNKDSVITDFDSDFDYKILNPTIALNFGTDESFSSSGFKLRSNSPPARTRSPRIATVISATDLFPLTEKALKERRENLKFNVQKDEFTQDIMMKPINPRSSSVHLDASMDTLNLLDMKTSMDIQTRMAMNVNGLTVESRKVNYEDDARSGSQDTDIEEGRKLKNNKREYLSEDQKRRNHILSEKRRRCAIKSQFETLCRLTSPAVGRGKMGSQSKCAVLNHVADYIEQLRANNEQLSSLLDI